MTVCIRCGTCCLSCPCSDKAKLDKNGICVYLSFDGDIASCNLIVKGKLDKKKEFREGCGLARMEPAYREYYTKRAEKNRLFITQQRKDTKP